VEAGGAKVEERMVVRGGELIFRSRVSERGAQSRAIEEASGSGYEAGKGVAVEDVGAETPAYVAFTSGSTGAPKAIIGTHGPISHFIKWHVETFGLSERDGFSMLSGLSHDPLQRDMFTALSVGGRLLIPSEEEMSSGERLRQWLGRERVSVAHLTPALAQLITSSSQGEGAEPDEAAMPSLRYAFFGADMLTRRDVWRLKRQAPRVTCVNFYGATETPQA